MENLDSKIWPVTSSEQPSRDPQLGRAGSAGWCVGGPCSRHGRTSSGPAGCDGADGEILRVEMHPLKATFLFLIQVSQQQLYNKPKPYKFLSNGVFR